VRSVAFQQLALAVRQRADLDGQQQAYGSNSDNYITDAEMGTMINGSVAKLWDILILKFGDNYAWGVYNFPIVQGTYIYQLPFDFYKEAGVDLALDTTGQNWATVRPFDLRTRNMFSYPLQTVLAYAGWQNLRYQIQGQTIYFLPQLGPIPGQMRLLYYQACPTLVPQLPSSWAATTAFATNQLVSVSVTADGTTANQVYLALVGGTSGGSAPAWPVPGTVSDGSVLWAYQGPLALYATTFDGISGYEEIVVLDAAIKALAKQEADTSALMAQLTDTMNRVNLAAANRSAGDPMLIAGGFGTMEGGPSWGMGVGPFGWGG